MRGWRIPGLPSSGRRNRSSKADAFCQSLGSAENGNGAVHVTENQDQASNRWRPALIVFRRQSRPHPDAPFLRLPLLLASHTHSRSRRRQHKCSAQTKPCFRRAANRTRLLHRRRTGESGSDKSAITMIAWQFSSRRGVYRSNSAARTLLISSTTASGQVHAHRTADTVPQERFDFSRRTSKGQEILGIDDVNGTG